MPDAAGIIVGTAEGGKYVAFTIGMRHHVEGIIAGQSPAPCHAGIGAHPNAFITRTAQKSVAACQGGIHDTGIGRIDPQRSEMGLQPEGVGGLAPGVAAVGGFEQSPAVVDHTVETEACLTGAGIDNLGILGIDGDGAEGEGFEIVAERIPAFTAVGGLPYSAGSRTRIDDVRVGGIDRQPPHPAAGNAPVRGQGIHPVRPYGSPVDSARRTRALLQPRFTNRLFTLCPVEMHRYAAVRLPALLVEPFHPFVGLALFRVGQGIILHALLTGKNAGLIKKCNDSDCQHHKYLFHGVGLLMVTRLD